METDPTRRFTVRAENYARYRPGYPREILRLLERECGLSPASWIADIGSGTGLLARVFLQFGCQVFCVEPNAEMRHAGERLMFRIPGFSSIDGRAEATGLPDNVVDFVTAGQAFHWFDPPVTRREFQRILKTGGWVVLVWNERTEEPGFMSGYDALVRFAVEREPVRNTELDAFFGEGAWRMAQLGNQQQFDLEGLKGRLNSSSYAPLPDSADYEPMMREIERLFREHQSEGVVTFRYDTNVYWGRVK